MNTLWEKYAGVLVDYSTKVQKGDLVVIRATSYEAQPLVKEIYKQVLLKGANPCLLYTSKLLHLFYDAPDAPIGIHPSAVIHPDVYKRQA